MYQSEDVLIPLTRREQLCTYFPFLARQAIRSIHSPLWTITPSICHTQVSYNTAMEACFKAGEPHRALELFEVMRAAHPTAALGTAAAATDKRDRKPPSGQAFKAGHEDGTTDEAMGSTTCRPPPPDLVTFNTALKGMSSWTGSSGREEIMAILRDMEVRALLERKSREASHEM